MDEYMLIIESPVYGRSHYSVIGLGETEITEQDRAEQEDCE